MATSPKHDDVTVLRDLKMDGDVRARISQVDESFTCECKVLSLTA